MRLTGAAHTRQSCMAMQLLPQNVSSRYPAVDQHLSRRKRLLRAMFQERPMMSSIFGQLSSCNNSNIVIVLDDSILDDQMIPASWLANAGHTPGLHRDSLLVLPSARWHHTIRQIDTTWAPHIRLAAPVAAKGIWCNYLNIKVGTPNCSDHGMRKYGAWLCISLMATVGLG